MCMSWQPCTHPTASGDPLLTFRPTHSSGPTSASRLTDASVPPFAPRPTPPSKAPTAPKPTPSGGPLLAPRPTHSSNPSSAPRLTPSSGPGRWPLVILRWFTGRQLPGSSSLRRFHRLPVGSSLCCFRWLPVEPSTGASAFAAHLDFNPLWKPLLPSQLRLDLALFWDILKPSLKVNVMLNGVNTTAEVRKFAVSDRLSTQLCSQFWCHRFRVHLQTRGDTTHQIKCYRHITVHVWLHAQFEIC